MDHDVIEVEEMHEHCKPTPVPGVQASLQLQVLGSSMPHRQAVDHVHAAQQRARWVHCREDGQFAVRGVHLGVEGL